ncbi:DUF6443 domain-containing protein [Aquimarina sp. Aq107]|uniref:DUF6443 domain-containing protein n=1 Tax=Aquimarina sp. Aq107 TaxID=1191912 RepID=UPI00131F18FA|nr:DUF6443 domain-containing protein [Aquimarina sp. Aq107]
MALLVLVGMTATAQVADTVIIEDETINASSDPALLNVRAGQSITIKPNTWIQSGTVFTAIVTADAYIPHILSTDENYVLTRAFQSPITEGMLLDPAVGIKNNSDVIENITYFDGLGRVKQQIGIKASPDKKDIVIHVGYDDYGRQNKQYLPFERQDDPLGSYDPVAITADINSYYKGKYPTDFTGMAEADVNAYSESIFEASPLNRVLEQGAPGKDWKADDQADTDHTIKFDWSTNGTDEVVYFKVNFHLDNTEVPILVKDGYYAANELMVTITKDENWQPGQTYPEDHTTREYTDKLGRVILKRTFDQGVSHDTYYVYDDFGNLTYVIPPKVDVTDEVSPEELAELCYQYKYDHRNRLVEKKIPGKGWEYIIYNKLDQPILTQDLVQRPNRHWLFTKYDAFGRVVFTGLETFPWDTTRAGLQYNLDNDADASQYEVKTNDTSILINGTRLYYSNTTFPGGGEIHTINYYDNYTFDHNVTNPGIVLEQTVDTNVKGLATGSKVRVLGTDDWITTVTYYDEKGRPIYVHSTNEYLNTIDIVESKLDFAGKVLETKTSHTKDSNAAIVTIDTFTYDHMGRLLDQKQKINNQAEEHLIANTYDELGQLESKAVGGGLQDVDYTYNVRGWLNKINDDGKNDNDLFDFSIAYNDITDVTKKLYNGNISQTSWSTASINNTSNPESNQYIYSYDALNRIKTAIDNTGNYDLTNVIYDKNGNILNLERKGTLNTAVTGFGTMDNLTYTYNESGIGNQLSSVADSSGVTEGFNDGNTTGNDYLYDDNGNMTKDLNKGISNITYNHLNLPVVIETEEGEITYTYSVTGEKLRKEFTIHETDAPPYRDVTVFTDYAGNYVYEKTDTTDELKFFNHPEGYLEPNSTGGYDYIYQYKDHLGNIRLSYSDKNKDGDIDLIPGSAENEIIEEKNYYPFGLQHKGYNNTITGREHNYGFGGKEEQDELGLGWIDITARNYDPSIARWMNLDPLAEQMRRHSPYNYAFNNPIYFIDPDGMAPTDYYIDRVTGKILGQDGAATNELRVIDKREFDYAKEEYGGTISQEATQELQNNSTLVTFNEQQIQDQAQSVGDDTASEGVENQAYITLNVNTGEVGAQRGQDGNSEEVEIDATVSEAKDAAPRTGNGLMLIAQMHGHPKTTKKGMKNGKSTSVKDKNAAASYGITVFAIDAFDSKQGAGSERAIHRVTKNGTRLNFAGKTKGTNTTGTVNFTKHLKSLLKKGR